MTINETTAPVSIVGNVSADGGYVDFTMDGGSVTGGTIEQDAIYLSPDTGLKADFNGGVVSATLEGSRAIFAETRSQDQTLTLAGTSVQAIALNSVGLYVEGYPTINGKPAAMTVHMSSGNLAASGASSKAIQTYSRQGPTQLNLNMSGGTIAATGQDSVGLLLHAYASSSAVFYLSNGAMTATGASLFEIENGVSDNDFATTIAAASTMTMDADGASYLINNRNDSAKASMQVSTSGKIKGHAMLGGGGSTFTLSGGSFVGNIYGDYDQLNGQSSDTKNQGVDNFVWTAGILTGDVYTQGGNDTATLVNLTSYNLGEQKITIDGGDGTDTLKLEAGSLTLSNRTLSGGGKVIDLVNWELITMKTGSSASLVGDSLTLNAYDRSEHIAGLSNAHGDLTLSEGSLLFVAPANGNAFSLSANVVLADASSSIVLAPGTETRIYGHVVNSGLIDMRDGLATSTLIIGDGTGLAYSGDSGRIAIDVDFAERKADRIILHGQAEGTTTLSIATVGEKAVGGDIVLAQTAATEAVTFALEGGELKVSGLHAYGLASTTGNGITTIRLADRGYQPYVPLYEAYPSVLLEMSRPSSLDRRAGARYDGGEALTAGPAPAALWGRTAGDFSHIDPESATTGYDYDLSAVQFEAGLDGLLLDSAEGALVGGLTGHYRDGEAKIASPYGASKIHPDGWGLGATLTWFGENGFYADGQALATWYTSELKAEDLPLAPEDSDAFAYAFSAEIGQAFALSDGLSLTPQAQLAFTSVHIDGFTGAYSDKVDFDDGQSLFARLGAKLEKTAAWQDAAGLSRKARLYGAANIGHEFLGKTTATVSDIYAFSSEPDDWAGEIAIGGAIDWQAGKLQYAAFAEITATTGFSTGSYGYGGNLGLKVKF
ncbi:autotransporter outer membrane beta-barrel domain-containing protein [Martelella radicis]|uniref:Outer membrane autotransporter protein n=1 Tax=Martelella radicis TaxID=1397476 RepID=A0A7W6PAE0_9HYPH|nr:outer membrane autotransporter protein [Martelella radicis]